MCNTYHTTSPACSSVGEESACNVGDLRSIPGLERSPGEGKDYSLKYSGLENSIDCVVHGVAKSWTQLNDFHTHTPMAQWLKNTSAMQKMKDTQV